MLRRSARIKSQTKNTMALPPPTLYSVNFLMSPLHGDINPSTPEVMFLFVKATSNLPSFETGQDVSQNISNSLINQVRRDSDNFVWGKLFNQVNVY